MKNDLIPKDNLFDAEIDSLINIRAAILQYLAILAVALLLNCIQIQEYQMLKFPLS
jgi:hypothetical protein